MINSCKDCVYCDFRETKNKKYYGYCTVFKTLMIVVQENCPKYKLVTDKEGA
jgi:hypothetical protein